MILNEDLLTFGGVAYPKFGNIVIMAGGSGSGKGFVLNNLVGLEGKVFDVDRLKELAQQSTIIASKFKAMTGMHLSNIDFKDPEDVSLLHEFISELELPTRRESAFALSVLEASPDRKPNIIFDVTLRNLDKLEQICKLATRLGYSKDKINLVWVVNNIDVARKQNLSRSRSVPDEILVNTHTGVANTMNQLLSDSNVLSNYLDGDIYIVFNVAGVDAEYIKSEFGGGYISDANYFHIKKSGKPVQLPRDVANKIKSYTPKQKGW